MMMKWLMCAFLATCCSPEKESIPYDAGVDAREGPDAEPGLATFCAADVSVHQICPGFSPWGNSCATCFGDAEACMSEDGYYCVQKCEECR